MEKICFISSVFRLFLYFSIVVMVVCPILLLKIIQKEKNKQTSDDSKVILWYIYFVYQW